MSKSDPSPTRVWTTLIVIVVFLYIAVHAVVVDYTSSHCSNFQNRSCAASVWKVWEW